MFRLRNSFRSSDTRNAGLRRKADKDKAMDMANQVYDGLGRINEDLEDLSQTMGTVFTYQYNIDGIDENKDVKEIKRIIKKDLSDLYEVLRRKFLRAYKDCEKCKGSLEDLVGEIMD